MKKGGSTPFGAVSVFFFPQYNIWVVSLPPTLLHNKQKRQADANKSKKAARAITGERKEKSDGRRRKTEEGERVHYSNSAHSFVLSQLHFFLRHFRVKSKEKKEQVETWTGVE